MRIVNNFARKKQKFQAETSQTKVQNMCDTSARLDGKVAIITGGSSGIGLETAKNLASRGARVIIASRNDSKLTEAVDEIFQVSGNPDVDYRTLDLGSLKSVREFAAETMYMESRLDILINNAGAVNLPDKLTADGLNLTMQVNYFGAFLLTYLLLPLLKASTPSRIITSSAVTMYVGEIDFDHWNDIGRYNSITSLANSKLADSLFTAELSRRLKGTGVTANSFDPFVVRDTDILGNVPGFLQHISRFFVDIIGQRKEDVGKQVAYLASAPELEEESGIQFKFCKKFFNHWLEHDEGLTKRLWEESKALVKISDDENWESNNIK